MLKPIYFGKIATSAVRLDELTYSDVFLFLNKLLFGLGSEARTDTNLNYIILNYKSIISVASFSECINLKA
jgi:hypothetical protein